MLSFSLKPKIHLVTHLLFVFLGIALMAFEEQHVVVVILCFLSTLSPQITAS